MKTIVRKPLMIKVIKFRLRNLDKQDLINNNHCILIRCFNVSISGQRTCENCTCHK